MVYGHFNDLPGLLDALIEREADRATAQLEAVLPQPAPGGDPVELPAGCLEDWLEAVREAPATWRMVLMPPEGAPPELHEGIAELRAEAALHLQRRGCPRAGLGRGAGVTRPWSSLPACCSRSRRRRRGCCSATRSAIRSSGSSATPAGCSTFGPS